MDTSVFVYRKTLNEKWKYILEAPLQIKLNSITNLKGVFWSVGSRKPTKLAFINKDLLTIQPGYAWDGATCAPDFPGVMRASLVHDAELQFLQIPEYSQYRTVYLIDRLFFDLMKEDKFPLKEIYFSAVRTYHIITSTEIGKKISTALINKPLPSCRFAPD